MIVTLRDNSYSRAVAQDNPFPDPLAMTVQRRAITDSERKGVMMFVALPLKISDDVMYQPPNFQNIYFDWATCLYIKQSLHKKLKGKCNAKISPISKGDGISYNIEFTKLTWIQAARSVNFRLSMSTPLNYPLAYNKKNSSSYASKTIVIRNF